MAGHPASDAKGRVGARLGREIPPLKAFEAAALNFASVYTIWRVAGVRRHIELLYHPTSRNISIHSVQLDFCLYILFILYGRKRFCRVPKI